MKCPKCQKMSPVGAKYCVWCGCRLTPVVVSGGNQLLDYFAANNQTSGADGLPEIRRHLDEMAVRLTKVEGQVTLISDRIGLAQVEAHPKTKAGDVLSQPESWGEGAVESMTTGAVRAEPVQPAPTLWPTPVTPETLRSPPAPEYVPAQETLTSREGAELRATARPTEKVAPMEPVVGAPKSEDAFRLAYPPEEPSGAATALPLSPRKPPEAPKPSQLARRMRDWEQSLPGNWLSRIGIMALFIGLGFLAKLAYDEGWVRPVLQLLIGVGCGGLLLLAGQHWIKRYRVWAQALTGGGIAVLYLSIFASYALNDLMDFFPTFALMFLVTILAVAIALRRESMAIAIIGIVGAFLVPIILSASNLNGESSGGAETNPGLMIAYILVLDAGIVGLSTFRKWRWFTLLGFGGSLAVYGLWYAKSGHDGSVAAAEWSLTGIFLCFAAATTLFHVVWRRTPVLTDLALMSLNAAVFFCVSYALLWSDYRGWLGLFSVGMAGLYAITGYAAWRRSDENKRLSLFAFAIAIVFLTIAIPVQLHRSYQSWITAAWAVEGATLIWIAVRQRMPKWQLWGLGAFCLALVGLFAFNRVIDEERFRPFFNDTFWAFTISILAFYGGAWCLRRKKDALQPWFFPAMMLTASILTLWLFSGEIVSAAGSKIIGAQNRDAAFLELRNIENARSLGLVGLWVGYGLCILFVGARKNWDWLRVSAYGLMVAACGLTVVVLNHGHALVRSDNAHPLVNYAFAGFAVCTVGMYVAARMIAENREKSHGFEKGVCVTALVAANVLTLWALSAEILTFVNESENLRNLLLVILWMGYGCVLMAVGVWRNALMPRLGAIGLVALGTGATALLLNHWHAGIERTNSNPIINYSFGGFAVCIAVLYLLARAVAENRDKLRDFEKVICIMALVAANVLTVWALSSEIVTFVSQSENLRNLLLVMLWMGYGCVLMAVGVWRNALLPRIGACGLLGFGVGATVLLLNHWHAGIERTNSSPIINYGFGGFAICAAALCVFAYLTSRSWGKARSLDKTVCALALTLANILTIWALSAEVTTFLAYSENLRNIVLVILWSGYGLLLTVVGAWKNVPAARFCGYGLIGIGGGMALIMLNHVQAGIQRTNSNWIANYSFGGILVCICAIYIAAYLMASHSSKLLSGERIVLPVLVAAANGLSLFALSSEILTYVPSEYGRSMGLTLLWAAYGLALVGVGVAGRWPWVRLGGLALVSVAILKLFIIDTLTLERGYRVAAYMIVGVLLLAGGFVYHRYADVIKGFIMDQPQKGVGPARK